MLRGIAIHPELKRAVQDTHLSHLSSRYKRCGQCTCDTNQVVKGLNCLLFSLLVLQMSTECLVGRKGKRKEDKGGIGAGAIVAICLLLALVIGITAWCVYAYRHPTSKSGLFLIEVKFLSFFM